MDQPAADLFEVFPWSPNFELGIPLIDAQHRELVRLLNRVAALYIEGATAADVEGVLEGLAAYAVRHFDQEEEIWAAALGEDAIAAAHRHTHADFVAELSRVRATEGSFGDVIERLLSYLTRWLAFHILDSDKRMALTAAGVRRGLTVAAAQRAADEQMRGAAEVLVQTVLSMYGRLVRQALDLMHERHARRAAEAALAEAEARLRAQGQAVPATAPAWAAWFEALFEAIPDAVVVADEVTGIIQAANPQAARLFGRPAEDLIGRTFLDLHPAEAHAEASRDFHRLERSGERWSLIETEIITAAGARIPVEVSSSRTLEVGGQQRLVGVFRDISERRVAEAALRASEARAREILERVPVGLLAVRADTGQVVLANAHICALLGAPRAAVIGSPLERLHPPQVAMGLRRKVARGDLSPALEAVVCRFDGGQFRADIHQVRVTLDGEACILGAFVDLTERDAAAAALAAERARQAHLEVFDALTELPNRNAFTRGLERALAELGRGACLAVVHLDLDQFTGINLAWGRGQGDALLVQVGARLRAALPEGRVARIGGDEFAALLGPGPEDDFPAQVAALLAAVQATAGPDEPPVSASAGYAVAAAEEGADAEQLLRQASQAMFQAKLQGAGQQQRFDAAAAAGLRDRAAHIDAVRHALRAGELVLHYQPKVDLATGALLGLEALVRWAHPADGLRLPGRFLPGLAGDPLLVELGDWVIDATLAQLAAWQAEGFAPAVSVNVESLQLADPGFPDRLAAQLAAWPTVRPQQLELEILETSALEETGRVAEVLRRVQGLGVSCALDDFGSGYASLTFLKRLPVGVVKIDQSFVRELLADCEQAVIIDGILGLARGLGRLVIAEGVETEEHGRRLLALGCQLGQGFAIARAMPASEVLAWRGRWRPPASWAAVRAVGVEGVPLLIARWEHEAWLKALHQKRASGAAGGSGPPRLGACRLSRWLQRGELRRHPQGARVAAALAAPHAALHAAADAWTAAAEAGDEGAADRHWAALEQHSAALLAALDAWSGPAMTPAPTPAERAT